MPDSSKRKPIRNFFIKRSIQQRIIITIVFVIIVNALLTTGIVALIYQNGSHNGHFYYVSNDIMQDLKLTNILGIILPALIAAQTVTIMIGVGIGLFSSRKVAVPMYKFEKWVSLLNKGNLNTYLSFRKNENVDNLPQECNRLVDFYRDIFREINEVCGELETTDGGADPALPVRRLRETLSRVSFE